MKKENLKRGNELEKEITSLSLQLSYFQDILKNPPSPTRKIVMSVLSQGYFWKGEPIELRDDLLPIITKQFILDYADNLENEIIRLQLEFDNL